MAESQMELANKEMDQGNFAIAIDYLTEARRIAVSADHPSLRIRTSLSLGNANYYLGNIREAFRLWRSALREAEQENERELAAVSRIHLARGRLLLSITATALPPEEIEAGEEAARRETGRRRNRRQGAAGPQLPLAQSVRNETAAEMQDIQDRLYAAFGWTVIALAEKELGRYAESEEAVKKALAIHERGRYLEQAAYDWYLIASIRSTGGSYASAETAMNNAIGFDRRAENSRGLASDWRALGDIRKKSGDDAGAEVAYRRSAEIWRSLGMEQEAIATEERTP
jgi:tetratricopeptide (TPR) repeat protein